MAFSIRTRLTFWYVLLLSISLLGFGAAFSYTLNRIFLNHIDAQITSVSSMMVHTVIEPTGQLFVPKDFDIILERFFGVRTAGNYIQIVDVHGKIVARSSSLGPYSLPMSKETYEVAVSGRTAYEVTRRVGTHPVRFITKPIFVKGNRLVAVVQVGSSLQAMTEIFEALFHIFIYGFIAAVAIAAVVGWFLARKALKPVAEITRLARRIEAGNLNERLNIAVPQDEIGRLAATMNEMIGRLEESFKQVRQFTADASHELKTPLTILKGEMEIALRSNGDMAYMRETLKSGLEEIDRMSSMVNNLLELARMDSEHASAAVEDVDLSALLTDRCAFVLKISIESGVDLVIIDNEQCELRGDGARLGRLVLNLIDNAIKYTPRGGRVELSLKKDDGFAVLKVKDNGVGITADDLPHIFDRFYRVDKSRTREVGGAGLGLSICKEIAVSHGGTISVESAPGKGACFTVRLPIASGGLIEVQ